MAKLTDGSDGQNLSRYLIRNCVSVTTSLKQLLKAGTHGDDMIIVPLRIPIVKHDCHGEEYVDTKLEELEVGACHLKAGPRSEEKFGSRSPPSNAVTQGSHISHVL